MRNYLGPHHTRIQDTRNQRPQTGSLPESHGAATRERRSNPGILFFIAMTIFWRFVMFVVTGLLQRGLNWRFYLDPKIHATKGLLQER
jgi:hypothetical protein